ncbi:hypothetical protein QQS21_000776 [Conoideocrella luteorostrata]|uniref:Uncharacterized protein n=1 Tax=Conoideocrella luteorostrata TaxID=1105319 RepID=A0AAJ0G2C8_9HYPO|nr:hypothetical protein QQS21_000776 [Conoideocrella luteorostrata]
MSFGVVDAIGVVGSVIGVIGFIANRIPNNPPKGASIRVKAGLPGDNNPGMDGDIAAVYAWDTENNYLGKSKGGHLKEGDTKDFVIDSYSPGTRAEYVGVAADKNAVCIAWITVKMYDETKGGAWTGDIGYHCGQNWFEQKEKAGFIDKEQKKDYIPRCTWLDADHTKGVPSAAMKFYTPGYGSDKVVETKKNSKACDFTKWGPDNGPINGKPQRRSNRPREPWMERSLVVSNVTSHRAENMCTSDTSWGPDFISPDGMFCDMGTKTLRPLCSNQNVEGCVDLDDHKQTMTKRSFVAKRAVNMPHKSYQKIERWD